MNSKAIPDEIIFDFCTKILPEYHKIMKNLEELHGELSPHAFAMQLMEFGREQMSEVADPGEQDVGFISDYTASLHLDNTEETSFIAYAGGCMMGLVMINEVAREDFGRALRLIEDFAQKEFNSND